MTLILSLVPPSPVAHCAAWHARGLEAEPVHGARCCHCNRDVAAPERARGKTVACIYCGLDNGELALEEIEP